MFLIGAPLLVITFAIYNMIAFLLPGVSWTAPVFTVRMVSGAQWPVTAEDVLLTVALLLLFVEILKATRLGTRTLIDHMLSMVLFIVMIVEFILVPQAASSTFFILLVISLVDVIGGYTVTIRSAQRNISVDNDAKILP